MGDSTTTEEIPSSTAGDVQFVVCTESDPTAETTVSTTDNNLSSSNSAEGTQFLDMLDHKRKELEVIQTDLNDLMNRLSTFIESQDVDDSLDFLENESMASGDATLENSKDIGSEKICNPLMDYYITDGTNPPEINWDVLAPYIQGIVGDLQKLRSLNSMTNSVMTRIRNVTESLNGEVVSEVDLLTQDSDFHSPLTIDEIDPDTNGASDQSN